MTEDTLDETIVRLERGLSGASDPEKAKIAQRLKDLLNVKKATRLNTFDQDEDLFDNVPI